MKRIALRFFSLFTVITLGAICTSTLSAQDIKELTATHTDVLSRKYLRPSRSVIFATDGSAEAGRLVDIMKTVPNDQFYTNHISLQFLRLTTPKRYVSSEKRRSWEKSSFSSEPTPSPKSANSKKGRIALQEKITKALEEQQVGRQIMKCWFPSFDNAQNRYSLQVLEERGAFAATDVDVVEAKAGQRSLRVQLNTLGEQLIDRSYVVVYYVYIEETLTGKKAKAIAFVYKLDFSPETMNSFYSYHFNSPKGIDKATFPLQFVYATKENLISSFFKGLTIDTSIKDDYVSTRDPYRVQTDYNRLANILLLKTDALIATKVHDFETRATIAKTSPISAKIGTKENLKTDDRFYVVENVLNQSTGKIETIHRGAVRVGRHIVDNKFISDGNLKDFTHFYQYSGFSKLEEGMTLISKPDLGFGITPLANTAFLGFETDYRASDLINRISWLKGREISGLFIFTRFALSFFEGRSLSSLISDNDDKSAPLLRMNYGLRKEFNIRTLNTSFEVGFGSLHDFFDTSELEEDDSLGEILLKLTKGFGISFGARFGCYLNPNINLFTYIGYDLWLVEEGLMPPYNFGLGMRFSF